MYFDRRLTTTEMSTSRVIVDGIALSGKRRMLKSESEVKALAAVSCPLSAAYRTKVTAVTTLEIGLGLGLRSGLGLRLGLGLGLGLGVR